MKKYKSAIRTFLLATSTLIAATGCGDGDGKDGKLLRADKPDSAEVERLKRLQSIRTINADGTETPWEDYDAFAVLFFGFPVVYPCDISTQGQISFGNAKSLVKVAETAAPLRFDDGRVIPPQELSVRAFLMQAARRETRNAIGYFFNDLGVGSSPTPNWPFTFTQNCSNGEGRSAFLVRNIAEASAYYEEVSRKAAELTARAGDNAAATAPSPTEGAAWRFSGQNYSRTAAARILLGGQNAGWLGSTCDAPLCSTGRLQPAARLALDYFRQAGQNPSDILSSTISTNTLLNDDSNSSMKTRLSVLLNRPELADVTSFAAAVNLADSDFEEARTYLQREIVGLRRTRTAIVDYDVREQGWDRYAGTGTKPTSVPPVVWATLTRGTATNWFWNDWIYYVPPLPHSAIDPRHDPSLSEVTWQLISGWTAVMNNFEAIRGVYPNGPTDEQLDDLLAQMQVERARQLKGSLGFVQIGQAQNSTQSGTFRAAILWASGSWQNWFWVRGEDGLRCAVTGTVEGASCDVADFKLASTYMTGAVVPPYASGRINELEIPAPRLDLETVYLIDPSSGSNVAIAGATIPFDSAGAFSGSYYYIDVRPDLEATAAKYVALDAEWCGQTQFDCHGFRNDDRIPLENDLASDGDGVESSWKHYLAIAKSAAEEARLRGEEYFNAGMEFERRKEGTWQVAHDAQVRAAAAVDEVQNICGSRLDARKILEYMSPGSADSMCGNSKTCIKSLIDFAKLHLGDPDMVRLVECLDSDGIRPFVSPGSNPLCVWVDDNNPNNVCSGASREHPCPVRASAATGANCTALTLPEQLGAVTVSPKLVDGEDLLGYFASEVANPGALQQRAADVCRDIRQLRGGVRMTSATAMVALTRPEREVIWERIVKSGFFNGTNLASIQGAVGLKLRPRNNVEITYAGERVWTSGDIYVTSEVSRSDWPCGDNGIPPDCTNGPGQGLFCHSFNCASNDVRRRLTDRLRGAVAMLATGGIAPGSVDKSDYPVDSTDPENPEVAGPYFCSDNIEWLGKDEVGSLWRPEPAGFTWHHCTMPTSPFYGDMHVNGFTQEYAGTVWWKWSQSPPSSTTSMWRWETHEAPANGDTDADSIVFGNGIPSAARWNPDSYNEDLFYNSLMHGKTTCVKEYPCDLAKRLLMNEEHPTSRPPCRKEFHTDCGLSTDAVLDALELSCNIVAQKGAACTFSSVPKLGSSMDLSTASNYVNCLGETLQARAGDMVLARVPKRARDALRKEGAIGAFPALGGDLGSAVSKLRGSLVDLADVSGAIGFEVRQVAGSIRKMATAQQLLSIENEKLNLQDETSIIDGMTACSSLDFGACASGLAKMNIAQQLSALEKKAIGFTGDLKLNEIETEISERSRALETYSTRVHTALESIDSQLAAIEGLQVHAGNKLAEAMRATAYMAPNSAGINQAYAWKYEETKRRYTEANDVAVKLAVLARRAIEQRLGSTLDELTAELPLVASPASWVDDICRVEGIEFETILAASSDSALTAGDGVAFMGNFVGEYVGKLERTIESYRLAYPFSDGQDVAVVSVRDDLQKLTAECAVDSPNLLHNTAGIAVGDTGGIGGEWTVVGCPTNPGADPSDPRDDVDFACLGISRYPWSVTAQGRDMPFFNVDMTFSGCSAIGCPTSGVTPGLRSEANLEPGCYYVSLIQPSVSTSREMQISVASNGASVQTQNEVISVTNTGDTFPTVARVWRFEVERASKFDFTIRQPIPSLSIATIGGVMLQRVSCDDAQQWKGLNRWIESDPKGQVKIPICKDIGGGAFRQQGWVRKCMRLCRAGYGDSCSNQAGLEECFHELRFRLDDILLENGLALQAAGFAKGNYNYRIDKIGVNFVGTGIRVCDDTQTAASCSGNATVQYSIDHLGPFYTRNYTGADVESRIFNGRIEHARGLAAERYLTNPLSSADTALLAPYVRGEFQGRPLSGEYVLRVWESPDVSFEDIEDVQLYLTYRYWTRLK